MYEVIRASDASAALRSASSDPSIVPSYIPLLSALLFLALAQFLKLFTSWYKDWRWDSRKNAWFWWNAIITFSNRDGIGGFYWPAKRSWNIILCHCFGLGMCCMYFCQLLNQIVCELPPEHPISSIKPLRDSLVYTPIQVLAGAVLGCIVAYLMGNSS